MTDFKRYKITLHNKNIYREIELDDRSERLVVGTEMDSDFRLRKDIFFDSIELVFIKKKGEWNLSVSDNLYINQGDVKKLATIKLEHGDCLHINYFKSNAVAFDIDFMLDFDDGNVKYDRIIDVSASKHISIGTLSTNDITINSSYTNKDKVVLDRENSGYRLTIENTTYGVYLNGRKACGGDIIKDKDFLEISDFFFYFDEGKILTQIKNGIRVNTFNYEDKPEPSNYPKFKRNTRIRTVLCEEPIEILDPPAKPQKSKNNIITRLVPALGMLAIAACMMAYGGSMIFISLISAGMAIVTSIVTLRNDKKEYKKSIEERKKLYSEYIQKKRSEIEQFRNKELIDLQDIYIDQNEEKSRLKEFSYELFDRTIQDGDFDCLRLGTGSVEATRKIEFKKKDSLETEDELQILPERLAEEYKYVHNAPVVCDLKCINAISIVGDNSFRLEIFKNIVIDTVSRQFFDDLKMYFFLDDSVSDSIKNLRFLPQVNNRDIDQRFIVVDQENKGALYDVLYKEINLRLNSKTIVDHINVFMFDDAGFREHPVSKYVLSASDIGVTFIFFNPSRAETALYCDYLIEQTSEGGRLISANNKSECVDFVYPVISKNEFDEYMLKMAPVCTDVISLSGALTKNYSFYEMFGVFSVDDIDLEVLWRRSCVTKTMETPIGVTSSDKVMLDLHDKAHGPHGLVAGTTGSGKSEVLQTYILSMALNYHPYEVGFVIIDFKGGGMVNQFRDLPHLIGSITNIDGKEIDRSLKSIKAELEKRQKLFAEADVNHIDKYIGKYKKREVVTPLPHLILIVDEFAELKADQPEFMQELISAARIGRSLGVHLILATQKPAGQVNDQIWSNSKFKICLKVQTKEDSNEVLKSPVAAEIREAGRGYLQVGNNEIFELFQSAYSGAPSAIDENQKEMEFTIYEVDIQGRRRSVYDRKATKKQEGGETQLEAVVNHVNKFCVENHIERLPSICLPPLPTLISYQSETQNICNTLSISVGIYDDPSNQSQENFFVNLQSGNLAIFGNAQSGKTNLLQLTIRQLSEKFGSDDVNFYIMDFGSMALKEFERLGHVGGVVTAGEDEKIKNLFKLLRLEMEDRKDNFSKLGLTSYSSYKEAGNVDMPFIVLMIDNFVVFKELYNDYEEDMINITRDGLSLGIMVVATGNQMMDFGYRYINNFANRVALNCNSRDEYGSIFDRCKIEPAENSGRCLVKIDKSIYECQSYLAFDGDREVDRVESYRKFVDQINELNAGKLTARRIPCIPHILTTNIMESYVVEKKSNIIPVGLDYEEIAVDSIDLTRTSSVGISGDKGTGKSNISNLILNHFVGNMFDFDANIYIVDSYEKRLEKYSTIGIVNKYTVDIEYLNVLVSEVQDVAEQRKDKLKNFGQDALSNEPYVLCVINNRTVFDDGVIDSETVDLLKKILKSSKGLKILFVFSDVPNRDIGFMANDMTKCIKDLDVIYSLDNYGSIKFIDPNIKLANKYKKALEVGDAFKITNDGSIAKLKVMLIEDKE